MTATSGLASSVPILSALLAFLCTGLLAGCAATPSDPGALRAEAWRALDDFHDAAAHADGPRYFGHFAPGAVFVGTDAGEHWDLAAFRAYAEPFFARGQGWTYVPFERHLTLAPAGDADPDIAWFEERLRNAKYGEARGSGVLVREGGRWRIAQYVLSFPIPNALAEEFTARIRAVDGG